MLEDQEVREIITEELIQFLDVYLMMTTLTHEGLSSEYVEGKHIKFGASENLKYNYRHAVVKTGRTKINFSFKFYKDEYDFVLRLIRLLDGYVDFTLSNWSEYYNFHFTFDTCSKANCKRMFDVLTRRG